MLGGVLVGGFYAHQHRPFETAASSAPAPLATAFDPAIEVDYVAHPTETAISTIELTLDGDDIVELRVEQEPPAPVLVAHARKLGSRSRALPGARTNNDYAFPEVHGGPDGTVLTIGAEPVPGVSSRRLLEAGSGPLVRSGDLVAVSYDLFSWSTGERVESSTSAVGGPLQTRLGTPDSVLPDYVDRSLQDRTLGSRVQVVLGQGTPNLPDHLNPHDGYVLVAQLAAPGTSQETGLGP